MGSGSGGIGHWISFEGIDGVGKTTQASRLAEWLVERGRDALLVREPGGTALGEALRHMILHDVEIHDAWAEFLLFAAARAELVTTVIRPALAAGRWVISDRFTDSSIAYQVFGRGLPWGPVDQVNRWISRGERPDFTVWLDGHSLAARGDDRLEQRDAAYFDRVQEGYAWLWIREPERIYRVPANQPAEAVSDAIKEALIRRWPDLERKGESP